MIFLVLQSQDFQVLGQMMQKCWQPCSDGIYHIFIVCEKEAGKLPIYSD